MTQYNPEMYIRLVVDTKLSTTNLKRWYKVVNEYAPSGTITGIQVPDENGNLKTALVVMKKLNGFCYDIPTTRDISNSELKILAEKWDILYPNNFSIESSSPKETVDTNFIDIEESDNKNLSETLAKNNHNKWLKDKIENGWRYGIDFSNENMTNPLLRPWEQLTEEEKDVDYSILENLVQFLNEQGFVVVSREQLTKWLS